MFCGMFCVARPRQVGTNGQGQVEFSFPVVVLTASEHALYSIRDLLGKLLGLVLGPEKSFTGSIPVPSLVVRILIKILDFLLETLFRFGFQGLIDQYSKRQSSIRLLLLPYFGMSHTPWMSRSNKMLLRHIHRQNQLNFT